MTKKIANTLNKFFTQLHQEYDINCGGCCYVASIIAKELEKRNIKYSLVGGYLNYSSNYAKDVRTFLQNARLNNDVNDNVECDFKYHLYITTRKVQLNRGKCEKYKLLPGLNSKQILNIYKNNSWSSWYNTRNNKLIKNLIQNKFKEVYEW